MQLQQDRSSLIQGEKDQILTSETKQINKKMKQAKKLEKMEIEVLERLK